MNMNKMMMTVAVAITVGNVLAKTNLAEVIEIVDGEMKWRFVPVAGTSQLPLKFMRTGKDRDKTDPVTMPKFWIAEKMITEGEFAALMGRKIREGRIADPVKGLTVCGKECWRRCGISFGHARRMVPPCGATRGARSATSVF